MGFRQDINGLRAIAVLSVLLFHFFPSVLPGGFAGVDVFFVISGYLMTRIICDQAIQERFRFGAFYKARAERIFPALAFLCLCLAAFSFSGILNIDNHFAINKHIAASLSFVSNMVYWQEAGYFDAIATEKWLLHTWSLSLEWQFYLLYPVFLLLLVRFVSWNWLRAIVLLATIVSLALAMLTTHLQPSFAYYALPTRAWALLLGGVAYLYPLPAACWPITHKSSADNGAPTSKVNGVRQGLFLTGTVLVIASFFLFDKTTPWPGIASALPVFGSYLIIVAHTSTPFFLQNSLMQTMGKWSYSIYLWHWPLLVLASVFGFHQGSHYAALSVFAMGALVMGGLSYRFIEPQRKLGLLLWAIVLVASASFAWVSKQEILAQKHAYFVTPNSGAYADNASLCFEMEDNICQQFGANNEIQFVLWGDSHAINLRNYLAFSGYKFVAFTTAGCPPIAGIRRVDNTSSAALCNQQLNDRIFARLSDNRELKFTNKLLMIGRWNLYRYGWIKSGQLQTDTHFICPTTQCDLSLVNAQRSAKTMESYFTNTVEQLVEPSSSGHRWNIMVLHGEPLLPVRGVDYRNRPEHQLSWQDHQQAQSANAQWLTHLAKRHTHVQPFDYSPALFANDQLSIERNGRLLFKDDNHLLEYGWQSLGASFLQPIDLWLQQASTTKQGDVN